MKNILLILVGGTICTSLNEKGNLSVDEKAGVLLKENYKNSDSLYAKEVEIDLSENLFILSENMTIENWNRMIDTYRKYSVKKKYDGVVFAHGTDTLAYSCALFSLLLSVAEIPVFFVSANERLESERSNGNENFRYAVECICRGIAPNVYVTYKNLSDGQMYLHLASRLRQCENYSEDFYSVGALNITDLNEDNVKEYWEKLEKMYPQSEKKACVDIFGDWNLRSCILMIEPYVGMDYTAFKYEKFSAVLHGTFHSGTACAPIDKKGIKNSKDSILSLLDSCFEMESPREVYLSPSILKKGTYETVSVIGEHEVKGKRIRFLYGYTKEMAYVKLVLAYSLIEEDNARKQFMETEYNFERIDKPVEIVE